MDFGNENALWLLFAVPGILIPVYAWYFWRKAQMLNILASSEMLSRINTSVSIGKQVLKALLLIGGFVSIVIALTEPKWNAQPQKIKRAGRDIVILLDTSRSMLAEDIRPSRLEFSKIAITDLLGKLQGDRVALITFAGNAAVKCPLTQDYAFLRLALAEISTESTSRGGTAVGDAIRKATKEVFDRQSREYKDIILITDGEEPKGYETFPEQAAAQAGEEGVRIIAIGLGDENEGARIPITGPDGQKRFLKFKGKEVWTKLAGDTLREVVYATEGGRYRSVGPGQTFDLGSIYDRLIAPEQKRQLESTTMTTYDERFQIFLALGIVLIVCEGFVSERRKV